MQRLSLKPKRNQNPTKALAFSAFKALTVRLFAEVRTVIAKPAANNRDLLFTYHAFYSERGNENT